MFPSIYHPSLYEIVLEQREEAVDEFVEELGSLHEVLRELDLTPPAMTTDGARSRLKLHCEEEGIEPENGDYLQPHGARRG